MNLRKNPFSNMPFQRRILESLTGLRISVTQRLMRGWSNSRHYVVSLTRRAGLLIQRQSRQQPLLLTEVLEEPEESSEQPVGIKMFERK